MTRLTETEVSIIQRSKAQAAGDWMNSTACFGKPGARGRST